MKKKWIFIIAVVLLLYLVDYIGTLIMFCPFCIKYGTFSFHGELPLDYEENYIWHNLSDIIFSIAMYLRYLIFTVLAGLVLAIKKMSPIKETLIKDGLNTVMMQTTMVIDLFVSMLYILINIIFMKEIVDTALLDAIVFMIFYSISPAYFPFYAIVRLFGKKKIKVICNNKKSNRTE